MAAYGVAFMVINNIGKWYISYLYVQTVTHQCYCFPNSQWGVTAHDTSLVTDLVTETVDEADSPYTEEIEDNSILNQTVCYIVYSFLKITENM